MWEPSPVTWDIVKTHAQVNITCAEVIAVTGMLMLGNLLGRDLRIIAGESSLVPEGCFLSLCPIAFITIYRINNIKYDFTCMIDSNKRRYRFWKLSCYCIGWKTFNHIKIRSNHYNLKRGNLTTKIWC